MAQVIKKHIYVSGAKSNDPLHIVSVPNILKFTKISEKGTQQLLKWYERAQKDQGRPNVTTSKIFIASYISICNNSRIASLHYFHFTIICKNYRTKLLFLGTQFYYFSTFKTLIANLDRKRFNF